MEKPVQPGTGDSRVVRHAARTFLNHVAGYGEVLREEAVVAARADLAEGYGKIVREGGSLREFMLPCFRDRDEGGPEVAERTELIRESFGLLYDIIAQVQSVKAMIKGELRFAADTDIILDAANSLVGLLEDRLSADDTEAAGQDREEKERNAVEVLPSRTGRVLIVDDSPFNRDLLARHLERQGHGVETSGDGATALALLAARPFDIVILDVMLPGMNGYELLERIRDDERLRSLYVLVVSAFDETESVARCIQLGAEDYLPRDFEPVILRARIESCLEKKALRRKEALYIAAVIETERQLRQELMEGAAYVRSLLPARLETGKVRSDWVFIPSLSLGGDVFGYHPIGAGPGSDRFALYLIDVSGHGIEAALYSVTLMNLLKSQVLPGADFGDPASVLSRLNEAFKMEEQNNLFFTAWYGVWDPGTRILLHASAGSPPAILRVPGGSQRFLATGGPIVGAFEGDLYSNASEALPPDASLYLFSDGVFEIKNHEGGMLGLEGFSDLVGRLAAGRITGGPGLLPELVERLQQGSASGHFDDDVSIVEFGFP
jgi:sigma-B regulation protein RsbU (phosphoserine phosphatase)